MTSTNIPKPPRRRRASVVAACTVVVTLVAATSCGGNDATTTTTPTTTIPSSTSTTSTPPSTSPPATPPTTDVATSAVPVTTAAPAPADDIATVVFFARDEQLVPVRRIVAGDADPVTATIEAWLEGPSDSEVAEGYGTAVPEGTRLLGTSVEGGVATVDLSAEFESGGGTFSMQFRLAQLVTTVTVSAEVDEVLLLLDGEQVTTLGGEGVMIDGPLTLQDVDETLPMILLWSVLSGDEVVNVLRLTGSANVFEATLSVQVFDDQGNNVVDTFVTATCGTGCRGTFDVEVELEEYLGPAVLRLFEVSPADGSEQHLVEVPFTAA